MSYEKEIMKEIGTLIKTKREELSLTQAELAKKLGVDRTTILKYEKGGIESITLGRMKQLSEILDVDLDGLLGIHRERGDILLDFISQHKWTSREQYIIMDYAKYILNQRQDTVS